MYGQAAARRHHRGIGRTFQNIRLFREMTALENVLVGMHGHLKGGILPSIFGTPRVKREEADAHEKALELLELCSLRGKGDAWAHSLSYGDQRRLEVARALATRPKLLLLDEPTAGMNPQETLDFTGFVSGLRSELGLTVLMIEHDMRVVMGVSDRVTVLDYGTKIAEGTPVRRPARPEGDRGLSRRGGGDRMSARTTPGTVLEVEDIHTFYGSIHALKGITITVNDGEIVTLIGSNGAGKSTTLRSINGLIHPRRGRIRFQGQDITRTPPHKIVGLGVSQSPGGPQAVPADDRDGEPRDGGLPAQGQVGPRSRTWTASSRCSPASPSAASRRPGRCQEASSRCARSAAR